jgi:hypothetical protein
VLLSLVPLWVCVPGRAGQWRLFRSSF